MPNSIVATTILAAMTADQDYIVLASGTGVNVPTIAVPGSALLIRDPGENKGELVLVQLLVTGTTYKIRRAQRVRAHVSGALVLVATAPNWFASVDPSGAIALADQYADPWVNADSGFQWLRSSIAGDWVPGFGNATAPLECSVAVASAAGAITPSGPLFHVTGTAAVTGFNVPVGGFMSSFSIIPDGAFTWTTAGNIALAGTAVVNKLLTFVWDVTNSKWIPSYIA